MFVRFASFLLVAFAIPSISAGAADARANEAAVVVVSEWNAASVSAIYAGDVADVVVVNAGYDRNFCTGARCRVERAGVPVAEIVIAAADETHSAALITDIANQQMIKTGDTVKLNTI